MAKDKSLVSAHYDAIAEEYDLNDNRTNLLAADLFTYEIIKTKGNLSYVYDMGCGSGRAISFLNLLPDQYTGIDISQRMIERARSKNPGYSFYQGDFTAHQPPASTSCCISLFGSPCYISPHSLTGFLAALFSITSVQDVFLGFYGHSRDSSTFEATSENGRLFPFTATNKIIHTLQRLFHTKVYRCDAFYKYKKNLSLPAYYLSLILENRLPLSHERFAWILLHLNR